jgi:disulfide bond formation protein DsbB
MSAVALFSSFYLQYVAGYQPCVYCYILRYLTIGILGVSAFGTFTRSISGDVAAVLASLGLVGSGLSAYLILDEAFPSASICTACSVTPIILGVSLYYYSIVFMSAVLAVSITLLRD